MQVLHTLGQAGCKTGTIAAWWVVWHVDSIYDTVFQFFCLAFLQTSITCLDQERSVFLSLETAGLFQASALSGLWVSLRGSHCCNQKEGKTALQG